MNEGDFELYGGPLGEADVDVMVNMIMIMMIAPFFNAFVQPGQIPFRVLLPLRSQSTNVRCHLNTHISHTKRGLVCNNAYPVHNDDGMCDTCLKLNTCRCSLQSPSAPHTWAMAPSGNAFAAVYQQCFVSRSLQPLPQNFSAQSYWFKPRIHTLLGLNRSLWSSDKAQESQWHRR